MGTKTYIGKLKTRPLCMYVCCLFIYLFLDRQSLWVVIITVCLIIIIVTAGVLAHFFTEEYIARIILITLICVLSILGISVLTYLELRKKQVQKSDKKVAKNGYLYGNIKPTAPRDHNWEYSNRSTLPS